jgi:beta-galactosidase
MVKSYKVTAFTYLTRQDGNQNGMVKAYEVYLSEDNQTWGSAVVSSEFKNTTALQVAQLNTPKTGRYLKFVAKSEINNNAWTSAAEIGIQAESDISGIINMPSATNAQPTAYYDMQGRRMTGHTANWPHGIYIYNGRKVIK